MENNQTIEEQVAYLLKLQRTVATFNEKLDAAKAALMAQLVESGEKTVETGVAKVTLVQSTARSINVEALRALVEPEVFDAITKVAVDWKAFDGAAPDEAKDIVEVKDKAPFLKVTVK
jgi:hypothetical protein